MAAAADRLDALGRKAPARIAETARALSAEEQFAAADRRIEDARQRLSVAELQSAAEQRRLEDTLQRLHVAEQTIAALESNLASVQSSLAEASLAEAERANAAIQAPTANVPDAVLDWLWAANAPLSSHPRITVVIPAAFPDRAGLLRSAIDSVIGQSYGSWNLLIVDDSPDGFLDERPDWLPADDRIAVLRAGGRGASAARRLALDVAMGDVIAYLDDDCRWYPWWLHAVAQAFAADETVDAVHGVRIVEGAGQPWAHADSVDALTTLLHNPVDTNVLAHRARLGDGMWVVNPEIDSCSDYGIVVMLAAARWKYLAVPAAAYGESAPHRYWAAQRHDRNVVNRQLVRAAARASRPLRVLAHNDIYPQLSETYVGDELEALRRNGVEIVMSRESPAIVAAPSRLAVPLFESLEEAAARFDPDVVLMHWGDVAMRTRARCAALNVPFAVRLHSFDAPVPIGQILDDCCVGAWGFAHWPITDPRQHRLDTLLVDPLEPDPSPRERSVLSASALLSKKGFETLVRAAEIARIDGLDIVAATTNGHVGLRQSLDELAAGSSAAVMVQFDLPYQSVQQLGRRAGALIYSLRRGTPVGQPRSVIEAALLGTPLVVPNIPALYDLVGSTAHFYEPDDAQSLAAAIDAALDSPASWDERVALAHRVRERHASEDVFTRWADDLTAAVVGWHRAHRPGRDAENQRWWWPG